MVCAVNKIDSNITGLRFAEEECLKQLPGVNGVDAVWYELEANSYSDFGAQYTMVARNPINASRQRKKGVITDLDASGGINQDFTQVNMPRILQGFMFADIREKGGNRPMNADGSAVSDIDTNVATFTPALTVGILTASLVQMSGFAEAGNNGIKKVTTGGTATITLDSAVDNAAPAAAGVVKVIGHEFASADVAMSSTGGSLPFMSSVVFDFTTLGLIPGEFIYVGGDLTANSFVNNGGFARIKSIAAHALTFDKTDWNPATEAGTGKTIRVFFGDVIRNEKDPTLIKRRTYQLERTLGSDAAGIQSEYLIGSVANELTVNVSQADKVNVDMTWIACDDIFRDGAEGLKDGDRPSLTETDAFNTSSDFSRIKLATLSATDSNPNPLFAFASEMTLTVNNNVSPAKAIGTIGAFDTNVGTFEVGGSITAYFADVAGPQAVRNNADVTLDLIAVKKNTGVLFDIPLLSLGDGRLNVEQDNPIMLTLENNAAESSFGHTLLFQSFSYLPNAATPT